MTRSRVRWTLLTGTIGCLILPGSGHAQDHSAVSFTLGAGRVAHDLGFLGLDDPGSWGVAANINWSAAARHPVHLTLDIDGWSGDGIRLLALSPAVRLDLAAGGRAFLSVGPGMASEWTANDCIGFAVVETFTVRASRISAGCGHSSRQYLLAALGAGVAGRIADRVRLTLRVRYLWAFTAPGDHYPTDNLLRTSLLLAGIEVR